MARYTYSCATKIGEEICGQSVVKDPCRTEHVQPPPTKGAKKKRVSVVTEKKFIGLHGWRCKTHGPTSVKRKLNTQEQ